MANTKFGHAVEVFRPIYPTVGKGAIEKESLGLASFHQYGTWGEDGGCDPCAIVEFPDGTVSSIRLDMIRFVKLED